MQQNKKRILVAVSGMTPQIITETLYGLLTQSHWIPDEIHLLTTWNGREQARLSLLEDKKHYYAFLKDFGVSQLIRFDLESIHVITDTAGNPLTDLRSPEDNEAAADFIIEKIRQFTSLDDTELHVSLAGGRKTMGFYVGYALSLFGRPQDKLSHVLVSDEFESLQDFYYPTPDTRVVTTINRSNGKSLSLDAKDARVWQADIPFVRLRGYLPGNALLKRAKFSEIVALVEAATKPLIVQINISSRTIRINGLACSLSPALLSFYLWFVERAAEGLSGLSAPVAGEQIQEYADSYVEQYARVRGGISAGQIKMETETLDGGMKKDKFEQSISKIKKEFIDVFGPDLATKIGIQKQGKRGKTTYAVLLSSNQIEIKE